MVYAAIYDFLKNESRDSISKPTIYKNCKIECSTSSETEQTYNSKLVFVEGYMRMRKQSFDEDILCDQEEKDKSVLSHRIRALSFPLTKRLRYQIGFYILQNNSLAHYSNAEAYQNGKKPLEIFDIKCGRKWEGQKGGIKIFTKNGVVLSGYLSSDIEMIRWNNSLQKLETSSEKQEIRKPKVVGFDEMLQIENIPMNENKQELYYTLDDIKLFKRIELRRYAVENDFYLKRYGVSKKDDKNMKKKNPFHKLL